MAVINIINDVFSPFICNLKTNNGAGAIGSRKDYIDVSFPYNVIPPQSYEYQGQLYDNPVFLRLNIYRYSKVARGRSAWAIGTH